MTAQAAGLREIRRTCVETLCRRSLYHFIRQSWPILEPGNPLEDGWHLGAIAYHLEAVTRGDIYRLVITLPPGLGKSLLVAGFWPAWEWVNDPTIRSQFGSYDDLLVMRDSVRCRDLITSDWYQETFRPTWSLRTDQNTKHDFQNTEKGFRRAFAIGGKITGHRASKIVLDDPLNARDRYSVRVKAGTMDLLDNVISTRVNDPRKPRFVLIMQRLAEDDPAGVLLNRQQERLAKGETLSVMQQVVHLNLPAEYDPGRSCVTRIKWTDADTDEKHDGWHDRRTRPLELLHPPRYTREVLDNFHGTLGSDDYDAQFNQNPVPQGGGAFKKHWFRRWSWVSGHEGRAIELVEWPIDRHTGEAGPRTARHYLVEDCVCFGSTDPACGLDQANDPTGVGVFLKTPGRKLVWIDYLCERMTEPESVQIHKELYERFRRYPFGMSHFVIEENSIGLPLVQNLRMAGVPVRTVFANVDKLMMATTARVRAETGSLFVPYEADWLPAMEKELYAFPGAPHDESATVLSLAAIDVFENPLDQGPPQTTEVPPTSLYGPRGSDAGDATGYLDVPTAAPLKVETPVRRPSPGGPAPRERSLFGRAEGGDADDEGGSPFTRRR